MVFNGICSGGLVEHFRGWKYSETTLPAYKILEEGTESVITVRKHDPQCLCGHLTTC